jgi:1-deoxy-D-xylulose-5-phosphate reductoisomerase
MRQPIQYALTWPERLSSSVAPLDWNTVRRLDFALPDPQKFPCIALAYRAIEMGGTAPAVLNATDEIAVEAFLSRRIRFTDIPRLIESALSAHALQSAECLDAVIEADRWAREFAGQAVPV